VDAAQRRAVRAGVAEPDVSQANVAACPSLDGYRASPLGDVNGQVEVLEDPAEQLKRALDVDAHAEELDGGPEELLLQRGEGDQGADRDGHVVAPVLASTAGQASHPVDDGGHGGHHD